MTHFDRRKETTPETARYREVTSEELGIADKAFNRVIQQTMLKSPSHCRRDALRAAFESIGAVVREESKS